MKSLKAATLPTRPQNNGRPSHVFRRGHPSGRGQARGRGGGPTFPPHKTHSGENLPVSNRNSQHTRLFKKDTCISKYSVNPECECSQGHHTPAKTMKSSRTAGTFHSQLAKVNKGPVGPEYNNRVRDRICLSTLPIQKTPPKSDLRDGLKRGSHEDSNPSGGRFLLHSVSCTKKRWVSETSDKLEKPQFFHRYPHFKMEGIHTLKKIDLKDTYFSVPISQKHRKFLCFQFKENLYQFNCLPFGLASAPRVFTKTLKPIAALGQELGYGWWYT